jgi:hypothetical protein
MPIPLDIEIKVPEKKVWPVLPDDTYQVEISDITPEVSEYNGEQKDVFNFEFTVIEEGEYYGRKLWKRVSRTAPIPSKNNKHPISWKIASAVKRHSLTEEEGMAFGVSGFNSLIGKQLRIGVTSTPPKDGKQYNNIESYFMVKQELPPFDESKVKKDDEPTIQKVNDEPFIRPEDMPSVENVEDEIDISDIPL